MALEEEELGKQVKGVIGILATTAIGSVAGAEAGALIAHAPLIDFPSGYFNLWSTSHPVFQEGMGVFVGGIVGLVSGIAVYSAVDGRGRNKKQS